MKMIHPLWTHLPALLLVLVAAAFTWMAMPLPEMAPVHFDIQGIANGYGSPWLSSLLLMGLSIGFLLLSAWLDELWARQEKKKAFNWISLFDELAVGDMCGIQLAYLEMLRSGSQSFPFPWLQVSLCCGAAVGLAVMLELLRPYRHYEKPSRGGETAGVHEEVRNILHSGRPLSYSESQNPAYAGVLTVVVSLAIFTGTVFAWQSLPWLSALMGLLAFGFILTYGGLRTRVTSSGVTVRLGIPGIRLLSLRAEDIAAVELRSFSALQDFGGYGIRYAGGIQAYFLRGDRGVLLGTLQGKKYLLGSDNPELLAALIEAARDRLSGGA